MPMDPQTAALAAQQIAKYKATGQGDPAGIDFGALWKQGATAIGAWYNDISGNSANNAFNAEQARQERIYNSAEAEKQRQHELYMANTAYQRAAADMRAAGINPATLSGLLGGGNSAGSSSSGAASASHASAGSGSSGGGSSIVQSLIGLVGLIALKVL